MPRNHQRRAQPKPPEAGGRKEGRAAHLLRRRHQKLLLGAGRAEGRGLLGCAEKPEYVAVGRREGGLPAPFLIAGSSPSPPCSFYALPKRQSPPLTGAPQNSSGAISSSSSPQKGCWWELAEKRSSSPALAPCQLHTGKRNLETSLLIQLPPELWSAAVPGGPQEGGPQQAARPEPLCPSSGKGRREISLLPPPPLHHLH